MAASPDGLYTVSDSLQLTRRLQQAPHPLGEFRRRSGLTSPSLPKRVR